MSEPRNPDGWGQRVAGNCPACGWSSLFVATGQHVTCATHDCPNPIAVSDALDGKHGDRPQYLVAVPPDVARLIEAVGANNLLALIRVAWEAHRWLETNADPFLLVEADDDLSPDATWAALGEALGAGR